MNLHIFRIFLKREQRTLLSGCKDTLNYVIYLNLSGTECSSPQNGPLIKTNTAARSVQFKQNYGENLQVELTSAIFGRSVQTNSPHFSLQIESLNLFIPAERQPHLSIRSPSIRQ